MIRGIEQKDECRTPMSTVMKKSLHITATIDQPGFLEDMVEKLASRHNDLGYANQKMPDDREALETSSTETFVSGSIAIDDSAEQINMPFITSFIFTCTKGKNEIYKLEWASSLS
jgi:hypothetical protein